jgi:uncharacterized membrane protein YraQ (UPF0718 family)
MEISSMFMTFLRETWWLTAEMAPYLLLGFVIAGLLKVFFTEDWVRRHLGQKGLRQIIKSVLIGIPLPLCSCGVIPVAAGIRRQGGQRGAVAAFTAATPQTGVDAIAATVGMLGWVFALFRVAIAFVNGIVAGLVVERWGDSRPSPNADDSSGSCCEEEADSCCSEPESENEKSCCSGSGPDSGNAPRRQSFGSGLKFGLVTLPADLSGALVVGLMLAGLIGAFVPGDFFATLPGGQFGIYLGMTLLSLPLYVCSTGSIPMAFTFLHAGMSPGAVLIFLIAGPATNTATVTSLWKLIGPRGTIGYIASIIGTSWIFAIVMDFSGISPFVHQAVHAHDMGLSPFHQAMAVILVLILINSRFRPFLRKKA